MVLYRVDFEPVAQIGDKVLLITQTELVPAEILFIRTIPWVEIDFGSLAAGQISEEREMKELYVEKNEFAQWRTTVVTSNVVIKKHKCPSAVPYYATRGGEVGVVPDYSRYGTIEAIKNLQLTEFYQFEDTMRYMAVQNVGTTSVAESKVAFFGYVFEINKLKEVEKPYKVIPCVARYSGR